MAAAQLATPIIQRKRRLSLPESAAYLNKAAMKSQAELWNPLAASKQKIIPEISYFRTFPKMKRNTP